MTLRDVEISVNGSWVKDDDQWLVQEVAADGAVTVARTMGSGIPGGRQVVLPAGYVRQHVGYATTTAHRAQVRTVDTAHAFVSVTTQREVLYVAPTRGRRRTGRMSTPSTTRTPTPSTACPPLARRGRCRTVSCSRRQTRQRAWPHGRNTPPHDGQPSSPVSSKRSTTTESVSTINIGCTPSTK